MNKTAITIASIVGVGVIGYFAWKKFGKKSTDSAEGDTKSAEVTEEEEVIEESPATEETAATQEDKANEVDLDAEETLDMAEEALDRAEEEADAADTSMPASRREERAKRRRLRLQSRLQRKSDRFSKRKSRRAESREKRKSRKKEREERAKKVVGAIPVVAIGKTQIKVGKQAAEKAKVLSKRLGGKLKRKKRSFGFVDEYYFCFDNSQSCKNFSNDNEDFAFNGMNF